MNSKRSCTDTLDPQWASDVGPFGGTTLRISGTIAVATTKQTAMAKKESA